MSIVHSSEIGAETQRRHSATSSHALCRSAIAVLVSTIMLSIEAHAQESYPAMPVGVMVVEAERVQVTSELPGRISATRIAEVRPRVNGIVERRVFEQGSQVREGDILFLLDRATYEIAVDAAGAAVARAEAVLADARQTEERLASLIERSISSRADYDSAIAARLQAEATLAETRAQLRSAEVNLGFTEIRAPISGRTGRALITEGALVSAQGEVMTTIQELNVVYADMQQPVSELLSLRNALADGTIREVEPGAAEVVLYLDDGSRYTYTGKLLFSEAAVERSSGQVTLRAEFPNPENVLLPGMYVRVVVEQATVDEAIVVPLQAVRRDNRGQAQIYLLGANSTVEIRTVALGREIGRTVVVESGLASGDVVLIDGFQKIGPGSPVAPSCWIDPAADETPGFEACSLKFGAQGQGN